MSNRCPCCESSIARRSKRRALEHVLSLVDIYPFRCEICHRRFLSRAPNLARTSARHDTLRAEPR